MIYCLHFGYCNKYETHFFRVRKDGDALLASKQHSRNECESACMCVCVRERERERVRENSWE